VPSNIGLQLYEKYSRREVHDFFVEHGNFKPSRGIWGVHGVVPLPGTSNDFVFFVTYGRSQAGFVFQEGVSEQGVITWQSQPSQHLREKRILRWAEQQDLQSKLYLFARPNKRDPYTYLGTLSYVAHDPYKEYPVWFEFQIENWDPPINVQEDFVRSVTSLSSSSNLRPTKEVRLSNSQKLEYTHTDHDEHVLETILSNPQLIDLSEGYRWERYVELDSGEIADLVFYGPGRLVKIICASTQGSDISYLRAVKAKLWAVEICFENEEQIDSEFIQPYLVAKEVNEVTSEFCKKYNVTILIV
jgi:hypothetical protein